MIFNKAIVCVDFDGTVVKHEYPDMGEPVPLAIETLKGLMAYGCKIILWTMRSGKTLEEAVKYMEDNGIVLYGVNTNPNQYWTTSPKAYGNIYIDDAAYGCPLIHNGIDRPFVDWTELHAKYAKYSSDDTFVG